MNVFEICGLSFDYVRGPVLKDLHVDFQAGKLHILIGPNGAGKSTLIKLMAGVLEGDRGQVVFEGQDLEILSKRNLARRLAYMAQDIRVPGGFTAREIVSMARYPYEESTFASQKAVQSAMERTGTWLFRDRTMDSLSGGEAQRVLLARAFCQETEVLLLDEVTSAMDLKVQHRIMTDLKKWTREGGTLIMALHDINLAARYGDILTLIKNGKAFAQGCPERVLTEEALFSLYEMELVLETGPVSKQIWVTPVNNDL